MEWVGGCGLHNPHMGEWLYEGVLEGLTDLTMQSSESDRAAGTTPLTSICRRRRRKLVHI